MKQNLCIILICVVLFSTAPASAAPTMHGSTGLIRVPSADVLRPGQISGGYYFWPDHNSFAVAFNALPQIEIGASLAYKEGVTPPAEFNLKYAVMQESVLLPAVAIGVEDLDGRFRRSFYGVFSKALPFGFRIHFGSGTGHFDGVFWAIEKVLNPSSLRASKKGFPVTSLILEFDGNHMNYGARVALAKGLKLDAGWQTEFRTVYLGMTYTQ